MKNKDKIFEDNLADASRGLLGFEAKKVPITKKQKEDFQFEYKPHPLCGCVGCMELAKIFVLKDHDLKESVISVSMIDLENKIK